MHRWWPSTSISIALTQPPAVLCQVWGCRHAQHLPDRLQGRSGHPLPLGNRPRCLPSAPWRLQRLSLCWLPQHTEVKQIELLFKLAGYSFDHCPFKTLCVLTGKMHATFQPPPPARGAVMPLANAYTHWALLSWKVVTEACPLSRMISALLGLSLTDVSS